MREDCANGGRLGLGRNVAESQINIGTPSDLRVTGRVPRAAPHERARQWIGDEGEVIDRRFERFLVESNLRVRQVVVVDEDEWRSGESDGLGDGRGIPVDVQLDSVGAHECTVLEVVETDGQPVGPDSRVVGMG